MKKGIVIVLVALAALIGGGAGYVKGYGTGYRNGEKSPNRLKSYEPQNCPCEVFNEEFYL